MKFHFRRKVSNEIKDSDGKAIISQDEDVSCQPKLIEYVGPTKHTDNQQSIEKEPLDIGCLTLDEFKNALNDVIKQCRKKRLFTEVDLISLLNGKKIKFSLDQVRILVGIIYKKSKLDYETYYQNYKDNLQ